MAVWLGESAPEVSENRDMAIYRCVLPVVLRLAVFHSLAARWESRQRGGLASDAAWTSTIVRAWREGRSLPQHLKLCQGKGGTLAGG